MSKYNQKLLDHAKQSATDALKTASKTAIHKTAEATGDLIGNEIPNELTRVSKTLTTNIQKQIKNKYLEKDVYLQNNNRKLLMI